MSERKLRECLQNRKLQECLQNLYKLMWNSYNRKQLKFQKVIACLYRAIKI